MAIRRGSKVNSGFSMASMTDIVFLLLIFFLITSTLVSPNAVKLLLPRSNSQTSAKPKASVSVKQLGPDSFEYYVGAKQVPFSEVEKRLQLELMNVEDPVVVIYIEGKAPVDQLMAIMNIASRNKYRPILATSPEQ